MRGLGTTSSIPEESDPEEIHSEVKPTSHNRNHDHKGSRTRASGSTSTLQHIADRVETHKAHGLSSRSFSTACLRDPSSDSATVSSTEHLATPNSSSTIYVDQTITNLGKRAMVTGLCNCVWSRINSPSPLDDTVVARRPSTTAEALQHIDRDAHEFATSGVDAVAADIRKYVERLFRELALDDGIAVVALIYLDRIERHAGLAVTRQTWKWLLSGGMSLALLDACLWLLDVNPMLARLAQPCSPPLRYGTMLPFGWLTSRNRPTWTLRPSMPLSVRSSPCCGTTSARRRASMRRRILCFGTMSPAGFACRWTRSGPSSWGSCRRASRRPRHAGGQTASTAQPPPHPNHASSHSLHFPSRDRYKEQINRSIKQ